MNESWSEREREREREEARDIRGYHGLPLLPASAAFIQITLAIKRLKMMETQTPCYQ